MGATLIYSQASTDAVSTNVDFGISYFTIGLSLNVLLTLMIVTRIILHQKNIRKAMGIPATVNGLYAALVIVLVESCALYAVNFLLFIGAWGAGNGISNFFFPILTETQVRVVFSPPPPYCDSATLLTDQCGEQIIAPFLIVLRVANRSALTSDDIVSGNPVSIHFRSQERSTAGSDTLTNESSAGPMDDGETSGERGAGVGATAGENLS